MEAEAYRNFFTLSPGYAVVFHNNGTIQAMSDTMASDLGFPAEEVVCKLRFEDLLTPGSRIFYQTHVFPLIRLHGNYDEIFLSFRSKGGEDVPVLLNARLIETSPVSVVSCAGIRITKRNRYEQEILEARRKAERAIADNETLAATRNDLQKHQRELELRLRKVAQGAREHQEVGAVLSHDLQEPLRKVSTFAKLLKAELESGEKQVSLQYLDKIVTSADRMRRLLVCTQRFVGISEKNFMPGIFDLQELVAEAATSVRGEIGEAEISMCDCLPQHFFGDRRMLYELFRELFLNAYKFRDVKKDQLRISVGASIVEENIYRELPEKYLYEQFVRVTISDNGIGFPEALKQEVFRLFRKGHIQAEGNGVGLTFCRKIAELHHGEILLQTEVGTGTSVTVRLPMRQEQAVGLQETTESTPQS